ncbi:hypothetical protein [Marinobacter sp. C2H3]|uniref:hypothetical protein n=1 Tax=Marinobacter sp. C2H3 TaxID=3119003 RepID=UPI00300E7BC0
MRYSNVGFGAMAAAGLLALAGCGGGGGSSGSGGTSSPTVNQLDSGLYITSLKSSSGGQYSGGTYFLPSGKFTTIFEDSSGTYVSFGQLSISNGSISGQGTDYLYRNGVRSKVSGTLSGTAKSTREAELKGSSSSETTTAILERQNTFSDKGYTLADIANTYSATSSSLVFTVYADGSLDGNNGSCHFAGTLQIPEANINVYKINFEATLCAPGEGASAAERNGNYEGIGTYVPPSGGSTAQIRFAANNGSLAMVFIGTQ